MSSFQLPFVGIYSAAKAAVEALAKNYHYELKHSGIESVVVQSGSFKTGTGYPAGYRFDQYHYQYTLW